MKPVTLWQCVTVLMICLAAVPARAFLTDTSVHSEPGSPPSLPTAGSTAIDPTFGTTIIRLTDDDDILNSTKSCQTMYSNLPSFNVDNTYVAAVCHKGANRFWIWDWDATTNTASNQRLWSNLLAGFTHSSGLWSKIYPDRFYGCSGRALYQVTVPPGASTTYTNTLVRDFASEIGGTSSDSCAKVSVSNDDDIFAMHYIVSGTATGYLVYKRSTDTVLLNVNDEGTINEVEIDKSGRWLVSLKSGAGGLHVWDLQGTPARTTVTVDAFSHRGMGTGKVVSACLTRALCIRDLATPNTVMKILPNESWSYASQSDHFSMTGPNEDWVWSCRFHEDGGSVVNAYDNECLFVKTDGSQEVRRFAHNFSRAYGNEYEAQTRSAISMDGRYATITSNWGAANDGIPNHVYILDLYPPVDSKLALVFLSIPVEWLPLTAAMAWHLRRTIIAAVAAIWMIGLTGASMTATKARQLSYTAALVALEASVSTMSFLKRDTVRDNHYVLLTKRSPDGEENTHSSG